VLPLLLLLPVRLLLRLLLLLLVLLTVLLLLPPLPLVPLLALKAAQNRVCSCGAREQRGVQQPALNNPNIAQTHTHTKKIEAGSGHTVTHGGGGVIQERRTQV